MVMATPPAYRSLALRPVVFGLAKLLVLAFLQLPLISAAPTSYVISAEPEPKPPNDPGLWLYLSVAAALVLSGGAFAGLTIALMGQVNPLIDGGGENGSAANSVTNNRMRSICR